MRIKSLKARQIINSQGFPTLQVEASSSKNTAFSSVPLASSKSKYEFVDAYDNNLSKFNGETLDTIVANVEKVVGLEFTGKNSMDQEEIDRHLLELDGTITRSRLGVNTITAISQAIAKLGALESDLPLYKYLRVLYDFTGEPHTKLHSTYKLPKPVITIHKSSHHNLSEKIPSQEILLIPKNTFSYRKHLVDIFDELSKLNIENTNSRTLDSFLEEIDKSLRKLKLKFGLGLDMAASRYKSENLDQYIIPNLKSSKVVSRLHPQKLAKIYLEWIEKYDLNFLEDIFNQDSYSSWHLFKTMLSSHHPQVQLVADDFVATNVERLEKVSLLECSNNVIIKPSQIGTVTECIHFAQKARKYNQKITVSYRHGETEDTFISDLAVGINSEFIRTGFYRGSEYVSKLNRLLQIEEEVLH